MEKVVLGKNSHHLDDFFQFTQIKQIHIIKRIYLEDNLKFWINTTFHNLAIYNTRRNKQPVKVKVKWSHYRPGVAQRVGRVIALPFHDRGVRRGRVVSNTPRPNFTPGKDPIPILQEAGWAPGPVWTGGKSRPHRDSIPDRRAPSQSLYWLSYPAHTHTHTHTHTQ